MPTPKPPPASKPPRHERAGRPPPSGHTEALRATLREWRVKKGMRQEDVANRLREDFGIEVGPSTISMWEGMHRNPDLAEMSAWARVVGLRLVVELEPSESPRRPVMVAPDRAEAAKLVDLVSAPKLRDVERILERLLDMSPGEVAKLAKYLANE